MNEIADNLKEENDEYSTKIDTLKNSSSTAHFSLDKQAEKIAH